MRKLYDIVQLHKIRREYGFLVIQKSCAKRHFNIMGLHGVTLGWFGLNGGQVKNIKQMYELQSATKLNFSV